MATIAETARRSSEMALEQHVVRYWTVYAAAACAVAFLAGWLPRLFWGFWTDEAGTYWMAQGGMAAAIEKCLHWPGQSILYGALESWFATHGAYQELLLRLPSAAGVGLAAWFLFRLSEAITGAGTGFLAVVPFLCAQPVLEAATSARPYGLALAATLASFWHLHRWSSTGSRPALVWYTASSILVLYLHYFFGFIFLIHLLYLWSAKRHGAKVSWGKAALASAVILVSLVPLEPHIALLFGKSQQFANALPPSLGQFLLLCFPYPPLVGVAVAIGVALVASPRSVRPRWGLRPEVTVLLWTWLLVGPVIFFAVSRTTPYRIFASRYLLFAAPAFFVILAQVASWVRTGRGRLLLLVSVLFATVLHPGTLINTLQPDTEEWRTPIAALQRLEPGRTVPVFVRSGLAESNLLDWQAGNTASSYAYAPLAAYPLLHPLLPLPYYLTPDVEAHVKNLLATSLAGVKRVALVAASGSEIGVWVRAEMERHGYRTTSSEAGKYTILLFDK